MSNEYKRTYERTNKICQFWQFLKLTKVDLAIAIDKTEKQIDKFFVNLSIFFVNSVFKGEKNTKKHGFSKFRTNVNLSILSIQSLRNTLRVRRSKAKFCLLPELDSPEVIAHFWRMNCNFRCV